jgi:transcriptional regulator with XRE-family HTH domain
MIEGPNAFASWLGTMGAALGYTNDAQLAKALEVNQSIVSRWRRGSQPSAAHLWRVGRLFRTDLEALLVLSGHIPALPDEQSAPQVSPSDEALAAAHRRIVKLEAELDRMRTGIDVIRGGLGDLLGANATDEQDRSRR